MAVADRGSFSRAAEAIGTRQSAVSRRVRSLEHELGVSLFERRPPDDRRTECLDRTRVAFAEIDRAMSNAKSVRRGIDGALGIGFLPSLVPRHLDQLLESLSRQLSRCSDRAFRRCSSRCSFSGGRRGHRPVCGEHE
ncbi:LysR family transcriptional regulator [Methylosinus sporium]|uniref:LysR family transcriptional regulator n=1 Tax=Methylosinus sporium TaxID=428 RepID=UPI003CCEB171